MTPITTPRRQTDYASLIVVTVTMVWIVVVSALVQGFAIVTAAVPGDILKRSDITPPLIYLAAALIQVVLLLLPLVPLALLWRAPRYRAVFRAWLAAALCLLVLSPARLVPSTTPQVALLAQTALALVFSAVLWSITGRGKILERAAPTALAVALAVGVLLALPWVLWGALGSLGDVILGIITACAIALAVTLILTRVWLRGMAQDSRGAGWDITLGGFVIGTVLAIIGSAIGINGTQILLLVVLSAFGWLLMDVVQINFRATAGWNDSALFALTALAIGAPLLLLDPTAGILASSSGEGEILTYAIRAIGIIILGAWLLGLVLFFLRKRLIDWQQAPIAWLGAAAAIFIALVVYFTAGQPGLFGNRVFVILKAQADVSPARNTVLFNARRIFVYNTLTAHANRTQSNLRATLNQFGVAYTPYYLVNAMEVNADLPLQLWLAAQPEVDRVLPSPHLRPLPSPPPVSRGEVTQPSLAPKWNLTLIGADRVWNELGVRGAGVIVGQSDSGADGTHPELSAQYRGHDGSNEYNWFDPWNHTAAPQDIGGHGTHTLGSIVGKTVGVAPDAQWIGCVNLARNLGNPARYLDCMQFDFAPFPQNGDALRDGDPTRGAMVTNNS